MQLRSYRSESERARATKGNPRLDGDRRNRWLEKFLVAALLTLGLSSLPSMLWTVSAHADEVSDLMNSDQLENLQAEPNAKLKSE